MENTYNNLANSRPLDRYRSCAIQISQTPTLISPHSHHARRQGSIEQPLEGSASIAVAPALPGLANRPKGATTLLHTHASVQAPHCLAMFTTHCRTTVSHDHPSKLGHLHLSYPSPHPASIPTPSSPSKPQLVDPSPATAALPEMEEKWPAQDLEEKKCGRQSTNLDRNLKVENLQYFSLNFLPTTI